MEEWFPLGTFPKCCFVPYNCIAGLPSLVRMWEEITSRVNMVSCVYRLSSAIKRLLGSSHSFHSWTNSVLQYAVIIGVLHRPLCLEMHKGKTGIYSNDYILLSVFLKANVCYGFLIPLLYLCEIPQFINHLSCACCYCFEETEGFHQGIDQQGLHLKSLVVVWYSGIVVNPKAYIWDFLCYGVNVCSISTPIVYRNSSDQSSTAIGCFPVGKTG